MSEKQADIDAFEEFKRSSKAVDDGCKMIFGHIYGVHEPITKSKLKIYGHTHRFKKLGLLERIKRRIIWWFRWI